MNQSPSSPAEHTSSLTPEERQLLKEIVTQARIPVWRHVLRNSPWMFFFVGTGILSLWLPGLLGSHNIAICRRWGTIWIPEIHGLAKILNFPGVLLLFTAWCLFSLLMLRIAERRRLLALLSRLAPREIEEVSLENKS